MPATSGEEALVPPTTIQPPSALLNTATPVLGSPTAETSDAMRLLHFDVAGWKLGFAIDPLHELPPSAQARSAQPRVFVDFASVVPPTATTCADVLGYCGVGLKPLSPVDAKCVTPVWVKCVSNEPSVPSSEPPQLLLTTTAPAVAAPSLPM